MMDVIKEKKYFSSFNVAVKVQKKGETRSIKMQIDMLGKFCRSLFDTNSCINVENLFVYPLGPASLALSCLDGTIRKTCKSKLYEAARYDLSIVDQNKLPAKIVMNIYFLDFAPCVRTMLIDSSQF